MAMGTSVFPGAAVDVLGYAAAGLVFSTFYVRTMVRLRVIGIASNLAFLSYGAALALWPIAALHGILLPLNLLRLIQIRRAVAAGRRCDHNPLDVSRLLPNRHRVRHPPGAVLFRKGEPADCAYYIARGTVEMPELGLCLGAGEVFGEIGLLSRDRTRTGSAVALTHVELLRVDERDLERAFHQSPTFALALVRLVTSRLATNLAVAEARFAAAPPAVSDVPGATWQRHAADPRQQPALQ